MASDLDQPNVNVILGRPEAVLGKIGGQRRRFLHFVSHVHAEILRKRSVPIPHNEDYAPCEPLR